MAHKPDRSATERVYRSGQPVPVDGMYGDVWGSLLPLLQGDTFPLHPAMGESKWTFRGALDTGFPAWKRMNANTRYGEHG